MKVLILDSETICIWAPWFIGLLVWIVGKQCEHCVFTVRAASERSVLVESMSHLKAVYFIRPTSENIQKLRYQLANPRFGEHHLCTIRSFIFQESRVYQLLNSLIDFFFKMNVSVFSNWRILRFISWLILMSTRLYNKFRWFFLNPTQACSFVHDN